MLDILEPFEVGHGHTTSIAQDIRQEANSFSDENLFCSHSGWTIGSFDDKFALEAVSIVSIDGLFESSGNEDITK